MLALAPLPARFRLFPFAAPSTTVRKAVSMIAGSERPVCCVENGRVVGVVDKTAVLTAIAGEGDDR